MNAFPRVGGFRPATRPGLAPAGESLLVDAKRNQKRLLNVHALHPTANSFSTVCSPLRTRAKYCSIRARASWPRARSTLRRRNAAHVGANSRRVRGPVSSVMQSAQRRADGASVIRSGRCRAAGNLVMRGARPCAAGNSDVRRARCLAGRDSAMRSARCLSGRDSAMQSARRLAGRDSAMQSARCIPVTTPVHGWSSISSAFSGGEHTVPNAVACPGVHERSKTFLVPFGVHQKGLACRGETRPGGRTET
jgi:hypothetical protein